MKIKLNISERIYCLALLNQYKGNLEGMVDILEDIKGFKIADEEWEKAERKVNTFTNEKGEPSTSWVWDDDKGGDKEIEITNSSKEFLLAKFKEANEKGQFTLKDKAAISIFNKLEKKGK